MPGRMREALLFVNGDIYLEFSRQFVARQSSADVYCTDGAFQQLRGSDSLFARLAGIIGDMDSCADIEDPQVQKLQIHYNDQEHTDFYKALYHLSHFYSKVFILGMGGGEMDHCLGNLSVALQWFQTMTLEFIDPYSRSFITADSISLRHVTGCMISVIPLFEVHDLCYQGLRYPLMHASLEFSERVGTRNYALDDTVTITFGAGRIMVFVSHTPYSRYLKEYGYE